MRESLSTHHDDRRLEDGRNRVQPVLRFLMLALRVSIAAESCAPFFRFSKSPSAIDGEQFTSAF